MLGNDHRFAKIGADTAENDPSKVWPACLLIKWVGVHIRKLKAWAGLKLEDKNGPFSSVSTSPIARVGAFFSIFRDLQDSYTFAPVQI